MNTPNLRGVTLIELIAALAIFVAAMTGISLVISNSQRDIAGNRLRLTASNIAAAKMDDLRKEPYDLITPTPAGSYLANPCDCNDPNIANTNFNDATWPALWQDPPQVVNATTYKIQWCVNYVNSSGPGAITSCTQDNNYKNIHVHISWALVNTNYIFDQQGTVSRS